jgi:hypothetical protein
MRMLLITIGVLGLVWAFEAVIVLASYRCRESRRRVV